jgi:lysophospholipase L1-like esterase
MSRSWAWVAAALAATCGPVQPQAAQAQPVKEFAALKFQFAPGKAEPGYVLVAPGTEFSVERGHGFDLGSKVTAVDHGTGGLRGGFCTSDKGVCFSVALPEGNYNVTVTLGDAKGESNTTVLAESRRLMVEKVRTAAGKFETRTCTVNIPTSKLAGGGQVKLKDREMAALHWDDKLTLEFLGPRPCVCAVEIARNDDAATVYLAGDSTVTDQPKDEFRGWGQMLPRFFKPGVVAVANHAESGEATTSFLAAHRLDKILDTLKKGDYLFIQFGHNDQNQKRDVAVYKATLKRYVAAARERGATPVLVTPMRRRTFDQGGKSTNTLGDYPEAVRQLAKEEQVFLIDLNTMSKDFYEALGPADSKAAFVDNTHTNAYGAYEFARYVADCLRQSDHSLGKHVVDDLPAANFKGPNR